MAPPATPHPPRPGNKIGAPHARLLLRTLLQKCAERVASITVLEAVERVESEAQYQRINGYESLTVRLAPL